jgi:NarL family two-component system response regulator LiaR
MLMSDTLLLLTEREKQVIQLLSSGLTYQKISDELCISHETVKMHIKNIYRKLQVENKIQALQKVKML